MPSRWSALLPLLAVVSFAAFGPLLASADPLRIDPSIASLAPSARFPLGTDRLGRDVLSRWLVGGQLSLAIASLSALAGGLFGGLLGAVAGFRGGRVGEALDRFVDITLALPVFFVAIALQAAMPSGAAGVVIVVAAATWMAPARVVRAQVIKVKRAAFVEAARALGVPEMRLLWRHIIPHAIPAFAAALTSAFGDALLLQSTLGFLGLGISPPTPTWGGMLMDATAEMVRGAWWQVMVPGLSIVGVTAAIGLAARGVGEAGWRGTRAGVGLDSPTN